MIEILYKNTVEEDKSMFSSNLIYSWTDRCCQ